MLAYVMLFATLSSAVCLYNAFYFISANAFCFNHLSWFLDLWFVYFEYDFLS